MRLQNSRMWRVLPACAAACTSVGASAAIVFDYAADFSIANGNPNGAWSYGAKHKDGQGKPTGLFEPFDVAEDSGWHLHWYTGDNHGGTFGGETWLNMSANWQYGIAPGHCSLNGDAYSTSTARWTAPFGGNIDLFVTFGASASARLIMLNDVVLAEYPPGGGNDFAAFALPVDAGDTIDVSCYGAGAYGNTQSDITVLMIPWPISLLALGFVAAKPRRRATC